MFRIYTLAFFLLVFSSISDAQSKIEKKIEALTINWAEWSNAHDVHELRPMYSTELIFYSSKTELEPCLFKKVKFFHEHKEYALTISSIDIEFYKNGIIKSSFTKQESWKGGLNKPVTGYLLFEKKNGRYVIVGESDEQMDSRVGYLLVLGPKLSNPNYMQFVGIALLISSILFIIFFLRSRGKIFKLHPRVVVPGAESPIHHELMHDRRMHRNKWA